METELFLKSILGFVRSGFVGINGGKLRDSSQNGYGWSSTPHSNGVNGYYLYFNASGVLPAYYVGRYYGFPLRCLSTVLDI